MLKLLETCTNEGKMCCKSNGSKEWNKNRHYQDEWWNHSYLLYKFKNWVANRMKLFNCGSCTVFNKAERKMVRLLPLEHEVQNSAALQYGRCAVTQRFMVRSFLLMAHLSPTVLQSSYFHLPNCAAPRRCII